MLLRHYDGWLIYSCGDRTWKFQAYRRGAYLVSVTMEDVIKQIHQQKPWLPE